MFYLTRSQQVNHYPNQAGAKFLSTHIQQEVMDQVVRYIQGIFCAEFRSPLCIFLHYMILNMFIQLKPEHYKRLYLDLILKY